MSNIRNMGNNNDRTTVRLRPKRRSIHSIPTNELGSPYSSERRQQRTPASEFAQFHGRMGCTNYAFQRELTRGGMSVIHEAIDQKTGEHVALKMVPDSDPHYSESWPKFLRREITALSRMQWEENNHKNIVRMLDKNDSDPFLVMEYLDGRTLRDLINEYEQLPWKIAKPILVQLCDALQAVHNANMVHSDVKPTNIMVLGDIENPTVKLLDFGIVRFMDDPEGDVQRAMAGTVIGTPQYMSPEQIKGHPFDHRADIYAVGTLMYELFTGQGPFEGPTAAVFYLIPTTTPEPPINIVPNFSPVLNDIIMRALEKEPDKRFSTAKEMGEAIRSCE